MSKMIVNSPGGEQQLIEVGIGGNYFDNSLVVWDERRDGAINDSLEIVLGHMIREGNDLIKSDVILPDHAKFLDEKPKPEIAPKTLSELISALKTKGII